MVALGAGVTPSMVEFVKSNQPWKANILSGADVPNQLRSVGSTEFGTN